MYRLFEEMISESCVNELDEVKIKITTQTFLEVSLQHTYHGLEAFLSGRNTTAYCTVFVAYGQNLIFTYYFFDFDLAGLTVNADNWITPWAFVSCTDNLCHTDNSDNQTVLQTRRLEWTHSPNRLVWSEGWQLPGAQSAFIKWTGWTLAMTMSWWQHHKHCQQYYYYYYYYY